MAMLMLLFVYCSHAIVSGTDEMKEDARLRHQFGLAGALAAHPPSFHGLDHPAVVIDLPLLECSCEYNDSSASSERGGDASSHASTCRAGDEASWILTVRGLVPGLSYKLHFKWSIADEQLGAFDSVISTANSSFAVRTPLTESGKIGTSTFDLIAHSRKLRMDVTVWDMYPGLTAEEALIGARHTDSAVNTVRVRCTNKCDAAGQRYFRSIVAWSGKNGWPTNNPSDSEAAKAHLWDPCLPPRKMKWSVLVTVSSAFNDMFENWLHWYQLLALDMPIILIAEDEKTFQKYVSNSILDTRLSKFHVFPDNLSFDYGTKAYTDLVSKRPSHILEILNVKGNVIYTDVDTVWLEDPRPYFSGDHDFWIPLDHKPGDHWPFCTGFMALLPTNGTKSILLAWESELVKKPHMNQPVFNDLIKKFKMKLSIGMLDRFLFPSGDIYFGERGLVAQSPDVSVNQPDHSVVVQNNFINGHANKIQRFKNAGLWWQDLPFYALSAVAKSNTVDSGERAGKSSVLDDMQLHTGGTNGSFGGLSPPSQHPPETPTRQHPPDKLVMISLIFKGNNMFVTGYPAFLSFNVKGLVQTASYQMFVYARSELRDSWDLWGVKRLKMDSKSEIDTSIQLQHLYLMGDAWIRVVITDMFPGLSSEDMVLSHVQRKIKFVEADKCDAAGQRHWNSKVSTSHISMYGWSSNPANIESATAILVTGSTARKRNWAVLVTVSSAFIDMFENWLHWYQLLELDMPIILIAEDQETFQKYESNTILDTRLSKFFVFQDNLTFDYDSKDYRDLVSKRPSHILDVMCSHESVIYTDVDTVWIQDPRPYFSGDHDLWLSLDFEPDLFDFDPALLSFFEFCTGFMAMLPTNGTKSMLLEWESELVKKPQLNQPVFNQLLTKFKLSIGMLDRVRFPSGDIFFGERNISTSTLLPASPLLVNVNPTDYAVVVHNNFIQGHANKVQRFKNEGLWCKDLPSYTLSAAALSQDKGNNNIDTTTSALDMLRNKLRRKVKEMMMAKTIASEPNSAIFQGHLDGGEQDFVLPRGMQQSRAQVSFSIEEIRRVQETTGLCNLLIFGLGFDSVFWNDANKLGSTVFLEDNRQWIDTVRKQSPYLTVYQVDYTTRVTEGSKYLDSGTWEGLRLKLPREIEELEWDIVLVDGPAGYCPDCPGRFQSIYTAATLRRPYYPDSPAPLTIVDDCDRQVEKQYSDLFLGRTAFIGAISRPASPNVEKNKQCFYRSRRSAYNASI